MTKFWLSRPVVVPGAHTVSQHDLQGRMDEALATSGAANAIRQQSTFVYQRSEIHRRHFELPLDEAQHRVGWYRAVNEATASLGRRALALVPSLSACDGLVAVSSSFAGFPSLSRILQESSGLLLDTVCYDLAGLGCAGPTHGLHLAYALLMAGSCQRVCVLCVDAMGTHGALRPQDPQPSLGEVVAHCLASDAAGAIVMSRTPLEGALLMFDRAELVSRLWPDSLDQNDLSACDKNLPHMSVGKEIRTRLLGEAGELLESMSDGNVFMHPGGKALMNALADAHPRLRDSAALSSRVLREHGNVGSSSLLWVLNEAAERSWPLSSTTSLFALGPGIVTTAWTALGAARA